MLTVSWGTVCAEAFINLPLTYGQTSFSRKLFLQHIECRAMMETEIKERWKWGEQNGNSIHMQREDSSVNFFSNEIRNRMCETLRI